MVRRRQKDDPEELTDEQELELVDFMAAILAVDMEESAFASEDAKRRAWEVHGPRLTEAHARERPGTRPISWWRWTAPDNLELPEPPEELAPWTDYLPADRAERTFYLGVDVQRRVLEMNGLLFSFEAAALEAAET